MGLDLSAWLHAALGNWQGWLSGGGLGGAVLIIVNFIERFLEREMPKKWYAITFLGCFFLGANYVAWHDAYLSMKGRESDLHLKELALRSAQLENAVLRNRPSIVTVQPAPVTVIGRPEHT
jgi:hypothetical protein